MQRFLSGTDEYRNKRLKIIPSLVDGPYIIKTLTPPAKEMVCGCESLPLTWTKHDANPGRGHCLALELVLDCVTFRSVRTAAGLLKRNLTSICMDVAIVVSTPDGQSDEEPQACLGMWRFDRIGRYPWGDSRQRLV